MTYNYKAPTYVKTFKCKCVECRKTCCQKWRISISESEYNNLITLDATPELRKRIDCCFVDVENPSKERFKQINPNYLGFCPMLDNDGMCMLQKEKGESAIPLICRVYPRSYITNLNDGKTISNYLVLSSSCEGVVEKLVDYDFKLTNISLGEEPHITNHVTNDYDNLHNKGLDILLSNNTLKNKLVSLSVLFDVETHILPFDEEIKEVVNAISILKNQSIEIEELDKIVSKYYNDNTLKKKYYDNLSILTNTIPNYQKIIENVLINHYLYSNIPAVDSRLNYNMVMNGFLFSAFLTKFYLVMMVDKINNLNDFIDRIAEVYHFIEHTSFYYNSYILIKNPFSLIFL